MQVAIFEQRKEAINIESETYSLYFAKPFESLCRENFSFLFKHLRWIVYDSGISTLINKDALQDTHYKHLRYVVSKENGFVKLHAEIAFVTEINFNHDLSMRKILKAPVTEIQSCLVCTQSTIQIAGEKGFQTIYSNSAAEAVT